MLSVALSLKRARSLSAAHAEPRLGRTKNAAGAADTNKRSRGEMTQKETKKRIAKIRKHLKHAVKNGKGRKILEKAGICNSKGDLKEPYK